MRKKICIAFIPVQLNYPLFVKIDFTCHVQPFCTFFFIINKRVQARVYGLYCINIILIFTQASLVQRLTLCSFCAIIISNTHKGGRNMAIFETKRLLAFAFALILLAFLLFSPLLDVYGEHDHSCSRAECALCVTANALSALRDGCLIALIACAVITAHLRICGILPTLFRAHLSASPVTLKNEILS